VALGTDSLDQVLKLVGPDSPLVLNLQLDEVFKHPSPAPQLLAHATQIAAKYPNCHDFVHYLGNAYVNLKIGGGDTDMGASLVLACLQDRYQPGTGDKPREVRDFIDDSYGAGYRDAGLIAEACDLGNGAGADWRFFQSLTFMGRFHDVILLAGPHAKPNGDSAADALSFLAFSAVMVGDRQTLDRCLADPAAPRQLKGTQDVLQYFSDRLAGKDTSDVHFDTKVGDRPNILRVLLLAEDDLSRHQEKQRNALYALIYTNPEVRLGWILNDAYERQNPWRYGNEFYRTLEWLHPNDPWVISAVAAYHARTRHKPIPTSEPDNFLARLKVFDGPPDDTPGGQMMAEVLKLGATASPWRFCSDVRMLVDQSRYDDARLLARRYRNVGISANNDEIAGFANHLLHRIDQLQAQSAAPAN
jgi:hypothetical protein